MKEDADMIEKHIFTTREEPLMQTAYDKEMAFYESICSGNIELVRMLATPLCSEGYGLLSVDTVRNIQYHLAISAALIARFCIRSGMSPEEAYHLSDVYIMKSDNCRSAAEVHAVHREMLEGFTRHMRHVRNNRVYSRQIIRVLDYINDNLHSRIMLEDAAKALHLSAAYLSRLFKSEVGMTFIDYVNQKKIESAANLLRYSEYTTLEISNLLAFSSQSYFIKIFKKYMGTTPGGYKAACPMPDFRQENAV